MFTLNLSNTARMCSQSSITTTKYSILHVNKHSANTSYSRTIFPGSSPAHSQSHHEYCRLTYVSLRPSDTALTHPLEYRKHCSVIRAPQEAGIQSRARHEELA